jgi:hypothetical protein
MDSKPWYMSKTVWASIIGTIVGILTMFKVIHIGGIQVENIPAETEGLSQSIVGAVEIILGLVALWGRITAKTTLTQ